MPRVTMREIIDSLPKWNGTDPVELIMIRTVGGDHDLNATGMLFPAPELLPSGEVNVPNSDTLTIADYEEVIADHKRLVRELDVILNGEEGAAKQASLCDIVSQVAELANGYPKADLTQIDGLRSCPFCKQPAAPNFDNKNCGCVTEKCPLKGKLFTVLQWNTRGHHG